MALTQIKGSNIADGTVVAADVADGAVSAVKVATDAITNIKVAAGAAIVQSKLVDIVNADVAANAAIVDTKISLGTAIQAYDADTAKTDVAQNWSKGQRGAITALTDGANIATDLSLSNNFSVTLAGNRTLDNPTNIVAGQSGSIFVTQDGTGSRTLAYGGYWDFVAGTAPVLTTTASAVDRIDYVVRTSTSIHAVVSLGLS